MTTYPDQILINGIDVTQYRLTWNTEDMWKQAIPTCHIEFSNGILAVVTPDTTATIKVYRTLNTTNDDFVFDGEVTQYMPRADRVICECKGLLNEAIKDSQTKSWDKDIDPQAGIGSEIFKDLVTHCGLSYSSASIVETSTAPDDLILKFVQNEEDTFQKMNELADDYNYMIYLDNASGLVNFKPIGFTTYPYKLTVGAEIPKQIEWKENKEQLVNQVLISGATVYDTFIESSAGPASSFTLSKTPEDTEVRIGGSTGTLMTRGQQGVGTLGTDYDYYVDVDLKEIVFSTNQSNFWIRYGAQVPLPIVLTDQASVDMYGGPSKTPSRKKFTFTDLKNEQDAENRGRALLERFSTPFLEAQGINVTEDQVKLQVIKPGDLIEVVDPYTNKDVNVFVRAVRKSYPKPLDELDIGDEIWRTEDWQADQMKKFNQIFNQLQKNTDILTTVFDVSRTLQLRRRYMMLYKMSRAGSQYFVLDSYLYDKLDTNLLSGSSGAPDTTGQVLQRILQGDRDYKEQLYDLDFIDTIQTTSTVDTTNREIVN